MIQRTTEPANAPTPDRGEHHLFLCWLMLAGLIVFALFVTWDRGWLQLMYATDSSRLCWAITIVFLLISAHAAWRIFIMSTELTRAELVRALIMNLDACALTFEHGRMHIKGDMPLPPCLVSDFIQDSAASALPSAGADSGGNLAELTEVYKHRMKNPNEIGWFASDLMIKLGLLGTVVGFIMMLASVVNVSDFDVGSMQSVLQKMSNGMGTALYTTIAGLVCSMLATIQYHMLDQAAESLIETARYLTHTRVQPLLARSNGAGHA
ncbi:MAG: MotA/TolQ/ExbB proton channel family protein [Gammaproteobacteria bacterium]|nr:MotA/TolQ/ExbB proton channel family protein [Gammaproteobacteria bacterium]